MKLTIIYLIINTIKIHFMVKNITFLWNFISENKKMYLL